MLINMILWWIPEVAPGWCYLKNNIPEAGLNVMPYRNTMTVLDVAGVTTTVYHVNPNNMQWLMVTTI